MFGSIYIGLSGLSAYSKGLQTVSNNISNRARPAPLAMSSRQRRRMRCGGSAGAGVAPTRAEPRR